MSAKKALLIGIVLVWLNQFCGCFAMLTYTAKIFENAGSNLTANMSAIIVGIIQLFGAYISTFLVDRAGRKVLFINYTNWVNLKVFSHIKVLIRHLIWWCSAWPNLSKFVHIPENAWICNGYNVLDSNCIIFIYRFYCLLGNRNTDVPVYYRSHARKGKIT